MSPDHPEQQRSALVKHQHHHSSQTITKRTPLESSTWVRLSTSKLRPISSSHAMSAPTATSSSRPTTGMLTNNTCSECWISMEDQRSAPSTNPKTAFAHASIARSTIRINPKHANRSHGCSVWTPHTKRSNRSTKPIRAGKNQGLVDCSVRQPCSRMSSKPSPAAMSPGQALSI